MAFGWDPAVVLCVFLPSCEVQPFVFTWLAPLQGRGSDGLKGICYFNEDWLGWAGKGCVGDTWMSRHEPGHGQAATGPPLHGWDWSITPRMEASFGDALCPRLRV